MPRLSRRSSSSSDASGVSMVPFVPRISRPRTKEERLAMDADIEQFVASKHDETEAMAKLAEWDDNGVPVAPKRNDPEFSSKLIYYFSAMAIRAEMMVEKEKAEEAAKQKKKKEEKAKKKVQFQEIGKEGDGDGSGGGGGGGSFTKRKGAKVKPVKTSPKQQQQQQQEEGEEEMTDDPYIVDYARWHGDRQWNGSMLGYMPAFEPLPQPTRDQHKIKRALSEWEPKDYQAKIVLGDGSGEERREMEKLTRSVKTDARKLEEDARRYGGWVETGPAGSNVRFTVAGQYGGRNVMAEEYKARAAAKAAGGE